MFQEIYSFNGTLLWFLKVFNQFIKVALSYLCFIIYINYNVQIFLIKCNFTENEIAVLRASCKTAVIPKLYNFFRLLYSM